MEHLAVTMLNWELRPFLSKWHPRLQRFEQTAGPTHRRFGPKTVNVGSNSVKSKSIFEYMRWDSLDWPVRRIQRL